MTLQMYLASAVLEARVCRNLVQQSKLVDLVIEQLSGLTDVTSDLQLKILAEQQALEQVQELELERF